MTIYPLPVTYLSRCSFNPVYNVTRMTGARKLVTNIFEKGEPLWEAQIQSISLNSWEQERQQWRAWRANLRGGLDLFSAWDRSKPTPLAYPTATQPSDIAPSASPTWDGAADVTAIGSSGSLSLAGLPANYVLSAGDYIGLEENSRYDLYEVSSDTTANGSGVVTVTVRPYIRTSVFTTSAVARLWRPSATFIINPDSWSDSAEAGPGTISFTGIQRI